MVLNDIEIFQKIADPLTEPRRVPSWQELSRRALVQDDKVKSLIDKWEDYYRTKIIAISDDHRLKLTDLGRKLLALAAQWTALTDQRVLPAETITVQAPSDVVASILPAALPSFFGVYGGLVRLRFSPLEGAAARKNIAEGLTSFAIDLAEDGEAVPAAEALGPKPWVLLVSKSHRLSHLAGPVSSEQVGNQGRVFVSSMAMANPEVSAFLAGVPLADQIECEAVQEMVAAGLGAGVALDLQGNQPGPGLTKLALEGVEPAQLRFVLPRRGASILSEPTQALVAAIRGVVETRFASPSPVEPADVPSVNGSAGEPLLTSLEGVNP